MTVPNPSEYTKLDRYIAKTKNEICFNSVRNKDFGYAFAICAIGPPVSAWTEMQAKLARRRSQMSEECQKYVLDFPNVGLPRAIGNLSDELRQFLDQFRFEGLYMIFIKFGMLGWICNGYSTLQTHS